jgi:serine/threonine protein kinase
MLGNVTARLGPGSTFAAYRIESVVGRGGMGVVYQATDLSLGRPVALKLIAPELADDPRFRQRFLDEPRLAASLDRQRDDVIARRSSIIYDAPSSPRARRSKTWP